VRPTLPPARPAKDFETVAPGRAIVTDLKEMKPLVKKKANPAFKRLQLLPLLTNLPIRPAGMKNYAAAPTVVIASPQPDPAHEVTSF
jgi:hypothetical protein